MNVKEFFEESLKVKRDFIEKNEDLLLRVINVISLALKNGNKLLICGNGGSAADAQHFAAEIVGRYKLERKGYPAIALTTDSSILTSVANDYDFDSVFSRQVEALGNAGDVLVGISTSGNSRNVINAFKKAKDIGIITVGLLGKSGGELKNLSDYALIVPSNNTPRIQETHVVIYHTICEILEKEF